MTDQSDLQRAVQDRRNGTRTGRGGGQGRAVVPANGASNGAGDSGGGGLVAATDADDLVRFMRQTIDAQTKAFRAVLPAHVDPDRFARLIVNACRTTPSLIEVFRTQLGMTSVLMSCMQLAAVGLEPNTPTQDAWILPRSARRNINGRWVDSKEAQQSIGYRGYVRLFRRNPDVASVEAHAVFEGDEFDYSYGLNPVLHHRPATRPGDQRPDGRDNAWMRRREPIYAYAIVRWRNGGQDFQVIDAEAIEARRAMSDAWAKDLEKKPEKRSSPWWNWPGPMAAKSAIRAIVPFVPLETEVARAIANDDRPVRFDPIAGALVPEDDPPDDGDDLDPMVETTAREAITAGGTPPASGPQDATSDDDGPDPTDPATGDADADTGPTVAAGDDLVTRRAEELVAAAIGRTNHAGDGPICSTTDGLGKQRARVAADARKSLTDVDGHPLAFKGIGELAANPAACAAYTALLAARAVWNPETEAF